MPELKKPIRRWGSLKQVQAWYHEEKDVRQSQKLNAIKLLMEGKSHKEVAAVIGVCVATIRRWTAKWNKAGKEGLKALNKGRSSKVTDDIKLDIEEVIEIKREIDGLWHKGPFGAENRLQQALRYDMKHKKTCRTLCHQ